MRLRYLLLFLCAAPLLLAQTVPLNPKDKAAEEPRYDTATNVDLMVVVAEVKEVPAGNPLGGMHLIVRPETARLFNDTIDVYLGPSDYLKEFACHFAKGDKVQVKGSRMKYNGGTLILAREVRLETTTVYLRDIHGIPYWYKS